MRVMMSSVVAGLAMLACGGAWAAPAQLYEKSIVVSWSETREQTSSAAMASGPRSVTRNGELSVYISSAGRTFNRLTFSGYGMGRRGGGRMRSGSSEQVSGESSDRARSLSFSGRTMTAVSPMGGGARRILVTFDSGFSGCSAQVLTGKASGESTIRSRSLMNPGSRVEILSVKTGAASCKIQNGNVFGN
jgi:hypothetical protein